MYPRRNLKNQSFARAIIVFFIAVFLCSCGVDKFIPQGEYLLNKNTIEFDYGQLSKEEIKAVEDGVSDIKDYVIQSPNTRILGIPYSMRVYCLSSATDSNWINRFIRSQGEAPVIYDVHSASQTARQMEILLESRGCFGSTVILDTQIVNKNRINVVYKIKPKPRYKINEVTYSSRNDDVKKTLATRTEESLVKSGDYYDRQKLSNERNNVSEYLRNRGFYTAAKEAIIFRIDTSIGDNKMNVDMRVRKITTYNADGTKQRTDLTRYRLNNVYIYPEIESLSNFTIQDKDTTIVDYEYRNVMYRYYFITDKKMGIRPQTICRALYLYPGHMYRARAVERTYSSLWALRNFRFADIEFFPSDSISDTMQYLDARVRLIRNMPRSVSVSLELNNTSPLSSEGTEYNMGMFGLELGLGYQNKNIFGGAEVLSIKTSLAVELRKFALENKINDFYDLFSAFENGVDLSLNIPKFLIPFESALPQQRIRPYTLFNLGINYQYRAYFERLMGNIAFGYNWQGNKNIKHQLLPIEFTLVKFIDKDPYFEYQIDNVNDLRLKYQYTDHLIMDMRYDFVYSTQSFNKKIDFTYFSLGVETAGNLLHGIFRATKSATDSAGVYQLYDIPFSQYVRINCDWKHYFYFSQRNNLVLRCAAGIGIPYYNSLSLPYEKSFYGGGPTAIRAWRIRTLGPGGFINTSSSKLERVGDISLIFNIEDRFKLFSIFEGAIFADAGNVWLLRESKEFPNGEFKFNKFFSQIALGVGLGLRANISILTLRLDFAMPVIDPGLETKKITPFSWSNIVTNFGIDYPF